MALSEELRRTYSKDTSYFGSAFNPAPERDDLGRRPVTPTEIIRAMNGEFNLSQEKVVFVRGKKSRRERR